MVTATILAYASKRLSSILVNVSFKYKCIIYDNGGAVAQRLDKVSLRSGGCKFEFAGGKDKAPASTSTPICPTAGP